MYDKHGNPTLKIPVKKQDGTVVMGHFELITSLDKRDEDFMTRIRRAEKELEQNPPPEPEEGSWIKPVPVNDSTPEDSEKREKNGRRT